MERQRPLCPSCTHHFDLLPSEKRCQKCFREISRSGGVCVECRTSSSPFRRYAACFDSIGPAKALLNAYLSAKKEYLGKDLAACIIVQLEALGWPSFDTITTVPTLFARFHSFGKEVARLLDVPYLPLLRRKINEKPEFTLKKECNIINQTVLLLQVPIGKRAETTEAGWTLHKGAPETIYGITLCLY